MNGGVQAELDFAPSFHSKHLIPAADLLLMDQATALRFEVYCLECKFLRSDDYPNSRELDHHDEMSAHFCALNDHEEVSAYVRLVKADHSYRFPFETHCKELLEGIILPPAAQCAEISRLMVRQDYRRRHGDNLAGVTTTANDEGHEPNRRRISSPQLLLCLYRRMYQYSILNDIRYWYAAMERPLARSLRQYSFSFNRIGPEIDYFGPVAPYIADLRILEENLGKSNPDLLAWMRSLS